MTGLETRPLGRTGLSVSAIGLGGGQLGDAARVDDRAAERLILAAFDLGISLVDTAPSYGASEKRIGRALASLASSKRDGIVVATKGGYGVPGAPDWTPASVAGGIERALAALGTDRVDVFLLHSCSLELLARGDLIEPLVRARTMGKVRAIGYSGDGDALAWAVTSGAFDVVECSVNLVDQEAVVRGAIDEAVRRGLGVIAKRALANAPWRSDTAAPRDYAGRFAAMWPGPSDAERPTWDDTAVRFAAYAPGVTSALVGTASIEHLEHAVVSALRGPLDAESGAEISRRFRASGGAGWAGVI